MTARKNSPWLQVGPLGKKLEIPNLGAIDLDHIDLSDLTPALSRQCRFNGHCDIFYSVIEHCCLVASLVTPAFRREALLHDLAEALIGDIPTPLKQAGGKAPVMARVEMAVARRFAFQWPSSPEVKTADHWALHIEYEHLCPHSKHKWECLSAPMPTKIPSRMAGFLGRRPEQALALWHDMWADSLVDG